MVMEVSMGNKDSCWSLWHTPVREPQCRAMWCHLYSRLGVRLELGYEPGRGAVTMVGVMAWYSRLKPCYLPCLKNTFWHATGCPGKARMMLGPAHAHSQRHIHVTMDSLAHLAVYFVRSNRIQHIMGRCRWMIKRWFTVRYFFCTRISSRSISTKSIGHILFHNTQSCRSDRALANGSGNQGVEEE